MDTGSYYSSVTLETVEEMGLDYAVEPRAHSVYEGTIRLRVGYVDTAGKEETISRSFLFWVLPRGDCNLLGMDFLTSTCSVLDLNPLNLGLWLHRRPQNIDEIFRMHALVSINGVEVRAIADTGFDALASCSPEEAEEFELQVEELEEPILFSTPEGVAARSLVAVGVAVAGFGKEERGQVILKHAEYPVTVVGMPLLLGARITFYETGDWGVTFPARTQ